MIDYFNLKTNIIQADLIYANSTEMIKNITNNLKAQRKRFDSSRQEINTAISKFNGEVENAAEKYRKASNELKKELEKNLKDSFKNLSMTCEVIKDSILEHLDKTSHSIQLKLRSNQEKTINDKAITMQIYQDYCQAKFYHNFGICDSSLKPSFSDSLEEVLDKIHRLQWNIFSHDSEGVQYHRPTKFSRKDILIKDKENDKPVTLLREWKTAHINLKEHSDKNIMTEKSARVRVSNLEVYLYDENGNLLPSKEETSKDEIKIGISFPTIFTDKAPNGKHYRFQTSYRHYCRTAYYTYSKGNNSIFKQMLTNHLYSKRRKHEKTESCEVAKEFEANAYRPTLDGVYEITLINGPKDKDKIKQIKIYFAGTHIPLQRRRSGASAIDFDTLEKSLRTL